MSAAETRPRVVLVMRCFVRRPDARVLLIRRSPNDRRNPSKWEVPGGKAENGQDIWQALADEVMQETGLKVEKTLPLTFPVSSVIADGAYLGFLYLALFCVTRLLEGQVMLSEEHDEHVWVGFHEMLTYDLVHETREAALMLRSHLV